MTLFISNPSRGGAAPSAAGDPVGVKAVDPILVSLRETSTFVNISTIQLGVGFEKVHGLGTSPFDKQLPRTRLGSLFNPTQFSNSASVAVSGSEVQVSKTGSAAGASVFFTSVDRGERTDYSAVFSSVFHVIAASTYAAGDPIGPVIGLEHGPRNTAVYCFFTDDGTTKKIRVCGPLTNGSRSPDVSVTYDWSAHTENQYIIFWNEALKTVELWVDDTAGAGGIGNATRLESIAISQFQQFGGTSAPAGGANDITGIYGVEGSSGTSAGIASVAVGVDTGFPFINGGRSGGWKSYLDTDITVGFGGAVDPTRLGRGGAWFRGTTNPDPSGQILPSPGGFCRLLKQTPSTNFSVFRNEPGFVRTSTDGLMVEFQCNLSVTGGVGFATGAAIQVSDGTTLFQLDFLFDGNTRNVGLLRVGGDPSIPSDHFLGTAAIDYALATLRLVVDPRRGLIDLFDAADLSKPVATWNLDRSQLPTATTTQIAVGLPVDSTPAVGAFDIYSLKYTYIYQAWETRDGTIPTAADPAYGANSAGGGSDGPLDLSCMPGVVPIPYSPGTGGGGGGSGTGALEADGYNIVATGGQTLFFERAAFLDSNRGGVIETRVQVTAWHPLVRTGVFVILDDGTNSFMLSFVDTDEGRFVAIPLSDGVGGFQEITGATGMGALLSVAVDWTVARTYRLERRPRDGVYLFIDNVVALVLPDSARYSFPLTQLHGQAVAFGQFTDEGATSVWQFVRDFFGSGYELSTMLNQTQAALSAKLSNARTTVVVTAGS